MPSIPTASHACTLFSLTMESRHGHSWRMTVDPAQVIHLAEEIVIGFNGRLKDANLWRFPDGSHASIGAYGVRREEANAAVAAA
ncbi:hypothetical protein [Novispirillum itersonii]|uniref:hypothetical protein n=1 Tax=Novispirillum itersonii TaxID=189 RepID=UPI0003651050|nr:hypothetical protein [Novispirillum itersonii]